MAQGTTYIGTSGWQYDSWQGDFYPTGTTKGDELAFYARHFASVEVNNSFYQLPSADTLERWRSQVPDSFLFSCKASRYITHMKKLKDAREHVPKLLDALAPLGHRLGPILFQLPPNWRANGDRLADFLKALPDRHRYSFEFRDKSWLSEEIYDLLREHNAALCFYDYQQYQSPEEPTADFIYLRLHGPEQTAYQGAYDRQTLSDYASRIRRWQEAGKDVFCYFDNDEKACAPGNARELRMLVEQDRT